MTPIRTVTDDLRGFIEFLEERHPEEVVRIRKEVDPEFGVSGILDRLEKDDKFPLVIFENIKGSSMPLIANMHASVSRLQLALGMEKGSVREFLEEFHRRESNPIPPEMVDTGPVKEVIKTGEAVNINEMPTCIYHEKDAGKYITAGLCLTRDPDSGVDNIGVYRLMVQGRNRLGIQLSETAHGHYIWKKFENRGAPCPMAVILGHHPAFFMGALTYMPLETDEIQIAGGILQKPIQLVRCETIPLDVPADAEIILECEILPHIREEEAPFGEYPGNVRAHADESGARSQGDDSPAEPFISERLRRASGQPACERCDPCDGDREQCEDRLPDGARGPHAPGGAFPLHVLCGH